MSTINVVEFADLLGVKTDATDFREIALKSSVSFVRSQDEVALWNSNSKGRKLTAFQVLDLYGAEAINEIFGNGSCIVVDDSSEPAKTIQLRRNSLGWSIEDVARDLSMSVSDYAALEDSKRRNPIARIAQVFQYFGLDEDLISRKDIYQQKIAFRLKEVSGSNHLNQDEVKSALEAIWLIEKQSKLMKALFGKDRLKYQDFESVADYGNETTPTFKVGYKLANSLRKSLQLKVSDPIFSIYKLAEERLDIPVIFAKLGTKVGGITINTDSGFRGVVINESLYYTNVLSMRLAIAHELGHLLFDSNQMLKSFRIDNISTIGQLSIRDEVEKRANAFSVEFLAPQELVKKVFRKSSDIVAVIDHFGISFSAAEQHILNSLNRSVSALEIQVRPTTEKSKEKWSSSEASPHVFAENSGISLARAGLFSGLTVLAERKNLIHRDVAAQYLGVPVEKYDQKASLIVSYHSSLFH